VKPPIFRKECLGENGCTKAPKKNAGITLAKGRRGIEEKIPEKDPREKGEGI